VKIVTWLQTVTHFRDVLHTTQGLHKLSHLWLDEAVSVLTEDVWGSGGIVQRILNLGTRWRRLATGRLTPRESSPGTHCIGG